MDDRAYGAVYGAAYVGLIAVAMFGAQRTPSCVGSEMMHQLATKVMEIQSDDVLSFIKLPLCVGSLLTFTPRARAKDTIYFLHFAPFMSRLAETLV